MEPCARVAHCKVAEPCLAGSDDPLLDQIAGTADRVGTAGSFAGLTALWQRCADAATIHLADREGIYNAPFAERILAGRRPVLVHLWRREQGIILPPGNPDGVDSVDALIGCTLALRAPGTGTRVLIERLLREQDRDPSELRGTQASTHLEAAIAVAAGIADAAIGLRIAAEQFALDFVPLTWEPYELAMSEDALNLAGELVAAISAQTQTPGLDLSEAGSIRRLPS